MMGKALRVILRRRGHVLRLRTLKERETNIQAKALDDLFYLEEKGEKRVVPLNDCNVFNI